MNGLVTTAAKKINVEDEATTKSKVRQERSLAKIREGIKLVKKWYIQGVIPADAHQAELRQPSLNDLAHRSGLSLSTLQHRSREEGWVDQHEAFARQAMDIENHHLVQILTDQHARARVAFFQSSMRVLTRIDKRMSPEEKPLSLKELVLITLAMGKAQHVCDTAIIGPLALLKNSEFCNVKAHAGWVAQPKSHLP